MNGDWLAQLAPARAPAPPSWWPPAMGWWILAALILASSASGFLWWRFSARARQRRIRRAAISELRHIDSMDESERASAIQRLMRRYAITLYGVSAVGRLSGEAWLRFVQAHGGGFEGSDGIDFLAAAFGKESDAAKSDWSSAAEAFIRYRPPRVRES